MVSILQELIKILPSLFWFTLVAVILKVFYRPIRDELIPNLTSLEAGGVKLSFLKDSLDAAIKLADKTPEWKVDILVEEKEKALKRANENKALFRTAKFLWVDDFPENNLNERQMFQQLGAVIDLGKSTDEALDILHRAEYDLVISDMARDDCPTAGLDLLTKLRVNRNRTPLIFYLGVIDETKGVPVGAFGLTNRPDELLHLTLDLLARRYS